MAAESLKPAPHDAETRRLRLLLDTARELGSEVDLGVLRKAWRTKTSAPQEGQIKKEPPQAGASAR